MGLYGFFIQGSLSELKQNFYIASKLKFAALDLDSFQTFDAKDIFFALFTDHLELIESIAKIKMPDSSDHLNPSSPLFILICCN